MSALRIAASAALISGLFALAFGAAPAAAAPCPPDLTVAGEPVTGSDCVTGADGSVTITNPRFGASGAVRIVGALGGDTEQVLSADRSRMSAADPLIPQQLQVAGKALVIGPITVGMHEFCDVDFQRRTPAQIALESQPFDQAFSAEILPAQVGCRSLPSFKVDFGLFEDLGRVAGVKLGGDKAFSDLSEGVVGLRVAEDAIAFRLPRVFGFDDERGGRVFGLAQVELPEPFAFTVTQTTGARVRRGVKVGVGVELSAADGLELTSLALNVEKDIPLPIPGTRIKNLSAVIDPPNGRFGGGAVVVLPGNRGLGGELILRDGGIEKLGFDLVLPTPGVPIFTGVFLTSIGGTFTAAQEVPGLNGAITRTPASIQGRFLALAGPSIAGQGALGLTTTATIAGPTIKLTGEMRALAGKIRLGNARILLSASPFRFEAEASVTALGVINGRVFIGLTPSAFTGLGEVSIVVPSGIPLIGGKKLGGFEAAVSNVGAGGLITIDPPLFKPLQVGVGTKWSPLKFSFISSLSSFITVRPSASAAAAARRAGRPVALAAAQRRLRVPAGGAVIAVTGARGAPRRVRIVAAGGGRLRTVALGRSGRTLQLGLPAGRRRAIRVVSPAPLARVTVARIGTFPYLDPSPGYGTRPRAPVTAGQPARVCWKTKGAVPRGTVVDLFEDQNGSLGSGRLLARGRRADGCFDVPTEGLEPGRHWVYGVVRVRDRLIGTRYWPIPITITDPKALPAPAGVQIAATADGARVALPQVTNATGYVITAQPADEHAGEPVIQDVSILDPTAELSLRGARKWVITAQAVDPSGRPGNPSDPITLAPSDPVVLAGKPHATAQVGRPWAFELDTAPGQTLRLLEGPKGTRLARRRALLRWTPSRAAGRKGPQRFTVRACKGQRCVTRSFHLSAYGRNLAPFGPARGFAVSPSVLPRTGGTLTIRAQGIDQKPVVKIDGKVRRARRIDAQTLTVKVGRLRPGRHDVSLRIGRDPEERRPGAIVVVGGR